MQQYYFILFLSMLGILPSSPSNVNVSHLWSRISFEDKNIHSKRVNHSICVHSDRLYLFGGSDGDKLLNHVVCFVFLAVLSLELYRIVGLWEH